MPTIPKPLTRIHLCPGTGSANVWAESKTYMRPGSSFRVTVGNDADGSLMLTFTGTGGTSGTTMVKFRDNEWAEGDPETLPGCWMPLGLPNDVTFEMSN